MEIGTKLTRSFWKNDGGNITILTGFGILLLVALAGAGADFGRQQLIHAKLQHAIDAAGLAVVNVPENVASQDITTYQAEAAERYYQLNFPASYLGFARPALNRVLDTSTGNLTISITGSIPTLYIGGVGMPTLPVNASAVIENAASIRDNSTAYEITIVLDQSGSMGFCDTWNGTSWVTDTRKASWSPIESEVCQPTRGAKTMEAIENLLDKSYPAEELISGHSNKFFYSFVAFSDTVRQSVPQLSDTRLGLGIIYSAGGGTAAGTGMYRARVEMEARTKWSGRTRIVILMTDGVNNVYVVNPGGLDPDAYMLRQCSLLKEAGVIVYTIAYGADVVTTPHIAEIMSQCASGNPNNPEEKKKYALKAITGDELILSYESVIKHVKKIRVKK